MNHSKVKQKGEQKMKNSEIVNNNMYWIDGNGNKWQMNLYSKEEAEYMSSTLINCYDCNNCYNLENCSSCQYIHNSKDCKYCIHGYNLKKCINCQDVNNSENCDYCKKSNHLYNCEGIKFSHHLYDCSACWNSYNCYNCSDCEWLKNAVNVHSLNLQVDDYDYEDCYIDEDEQSSSIEYIYNMDLVREDLSNHISQYEHLEHHSDDEVLLCVFTSTHDEQLNKIDIPFNREDFNFIGKYYVYEVIDIEVPFEGYDQCNVVIKVSIK